MAADSSNSWALRQIPDGLRKPSKQQQQQKSNSPTVGKNITLSNMRKVGSDEGLISQVKQEVCSGSSPEKKTSSAVLNDDKLSSEHGITNVHRPEHLTVSTSDELQQKLARVLGPMERFFGISETTIRQAVGITPQPPTPVSTKDSSRHKGDEHHSHNSNSLNSTPPSAKLLHNNAGDEGASSNKTSLIVPSMKKVKSSTAVPAATAVITSTTAPSTVVKAEKNTGDDSLLQRGGVKSATSSPTFPSTAVAGVEQRSGSQRQPTTDSNGNKNLAMKIAKTELNLKLFGEAALSSSESESESDSDSDEGNDSDASPGEQHRLLATAPASNNKKQQSFGGNFVAPTRKTGRHALTQSSIQPAPQQQQQKPPTSEPLASSTSHHGMPPPPLNLQQQSQPPSRAGSTNVTPQKAPAANNNRAGIDDIISSIYKNVTLPSPLSPQLLSPVGISSDLLSSRASLSGLKQQFSPVLPSSTAEEPTPPSPPHAEQKAEKVPSTHSSPSATLPSPQLAGVAASPPLPVLQPPPSWSLSNFVDGKSANKQGSATKTTTKSSTSNAAKVATAKESTAEIDNSKQSSSSRKTKLPGEVADQKQVKPLSPNHESDVRRQVSSTTTKTEPVATSEQAPSSNTPDHAAAASLQITSSKLPKVRRVVQTELSPPNVVKSDTETTIKNKPVVINSNKSQNVAQIQKPTPKTSADKRPACHVSLDTSELLLMRSSFKCVQTSPDLLVKTGCLVDGFSQTSWDLRAAFSTNCGVQAGASLVDANVQTDTNSDPSSSANASGAGQDAFGPSAPKQARRETACVQPLSLSNVIASNMQKPASPSTGNSEPASTSTGGESTIANNPSGVDAQSQLLRSKFTIKQKTMPVGGEGSSPFDGSPAEILHRERERRINVNVIDWRGTYTEQTLQSEKTYYERGRLSKREADQEFPKQRNLDSFCIYLDAMLAFLLQVCAHESAHGGKAESKRRSQLLTFIDEALSKCAPTARDLTIDPRWDIPLVLCHQSKAVLATRLYDMQSRDMLTTAASSIERAVATNNANQPVSSSAGNNGVNCSVSGGGHNSSSPPGSVGSNSSVTSSSSVKKDSASKTGLSHLAKSIELVTNAFRLLEASKTSWARAEELADKHKAFFDRFSPTLTLRASLLDLSSFLDRCITEFRALRNATGPSAVLTPSMAQHGLSKAAALNASSKQQLIRPTPPAAASSKH